MKMYKITNKTFDVIPLLGKTISGRGFIVVNGITSQMQNLANRELITIKEIKQPDPIIEKEAIITKSKPIIEPDSDPVSDPEFDLNLLSNSEESDSDNP